MTLSESSAASMVDTRFAVGQVVKHKYLPFRGVIFDVDSEFNNTEEWYQAIPQAIRPARDQPFYHLFAENDESYYTAYVSQQNLELDESGEPINHPEMKKIFSDYKGGFYHLKQNISN